MDNFWVINKISIFYEECIAKLLSRKIFDEMSSKRIPTE